MYDSPSYIGASRLMFSLPEAFDFQSRMTKPLVLILPGLFEWAFNVDPFIIFIVQNLICFVLAPMYLYRIGYIVFKKESLAYLTAISYSLCQAYAIYSLMVLSDIAGWTFGIIAIFYTVKIFQESNNHTISVFLLGLFVGFGFTAKESAIIGLLFFGVYTLYSNLSFIRKITTLSSAFLGFILPVISAAIYSYHFFDDSFLHRIIETHEGTKSDIVESRKVIDQIFRTVDFYWITFVFGIILFFRSVYLKIKDQYLATFATTLFLSCFLLPIWPYYLDRIFFMLAPFILIFSIKGISYFKESHQYAIVLLFGLIAQIISYLIYAHNISGLLIQGSIVTFIIFLVAIYLNRRNI